MDSGKFKKHVAGDQELAGKVTARGTPNIYVNGRTVTGAKPFDGTIQEIFAQLAGEEAPPLMENRPDLQASKQLCKLVAKTLSTALVQMERAASFSSGVVM